VGFLIKPIVTSNAGMSSTGKPSEKNGNTSLGFEAILELNFESGKENEGNVEISGLLNQMFPTSSIVQSTLIPFFSAELTENIDNQSDLLKKLPDILGEKIILQQDQKLNNLETEPIVLQQVDRSVVKLTDPIESGFPLVLENEEATNLLFNEEPEQISSLSIEEKNEPIHTEQSTGINTKATDAPSVNIPIHHLQNHSQQSVNLQGKTVIATPIRAEQLGQEVAKLIDSNIQVQNLQDGIEATFKLSPQNLGNVDVKVSIVDGAITADFLTSTQIGKDSLESHVQILRAALETQGFQVDKINISQQSLSAFLGSFSQKGESNGRHAHQDSRKRNQQQEIHIEDTKYKEFGLDSVSQINTTA
jgi:flagellar hook-length control protein FliK